MFKRKLLALDFPTPDKFDISDEKEFRSAVLWLEDQHIRHYKVEDRNHLRNIASSQWPATYKTYLNDVACPIKSARAIEEFTWLLTFGVRLKYGDNAAKYKNQSSESLICQSKTPKIVAANPLDNFDFNSNEFVSGVNALAVILNVTPHPNHLITLKAVAKVVNSRMSQEAVDNPSSVIVKGTPFPFQEADLGFDMGDYVLNQAAKILRLLYIHNLRDLQTRINECIVAVQSVTADPKTDTNLGKVGR